MSTQYRTLTITDRVVEELVGPWGTVKCGGMWVCVKTFSLTNE